MNKALKHKRIEFDYCTKDDLGVYSAICKECQKKYKDILLENKGIKISKGGGGGVCGVKGCHNSDFETDIQVDYIEFKTNISTDIKVNIKTDNTLEGKVKGLIEYLNELNYEECKSQRGKRILLLEGLDKFFDIFVAKHKNLDAIIEILEEDKNIENIANIVKDMFIIC